MIKLLWISYKKIILGILIFGVLFAFQSCFTFRMSPSSYNQFFKEKNIKYTSNYHYTGDRKIYSISTGDVGRPHIIFFHGAPGSSSAFKNYLANQNLLENYRLTSVDRPGYGYSDFGSSVTDLDVQSELLGQVLKDHKTKSATILVGHSLGGAIIAKLAIDFPELVNGIIIVGGSVDPELEPQEWFRKPLYSPFLRWMIPRSLRVTNDEIYFLKTELEEMLPEWGNIKAKVTVIQGGKDKLVDPKNAEFVAKALKNKDPKIIFKPNVNHFIPWNNEKLILDAINEMIYELQLSQSK